MKPGKSVIWWLERFWTKFFSDPATKFIDESGTAYGVAHNANRPITVAIPHSEIISDNDPNHTPVRRFGHNPDVGATLETLWHPGGLYVYLTSAERLQITSDDADDDGDPVGNGARTVWIQGLDASWELQSETITMNGVANVLTDLFYLRVFKLKVYTFGVTGNNEGVITASNNADTNVLMNIEIGEGESNAAIFTVPEPGGCGFIKTFYMSENSTKGTEVSLWARDNMNGRPWGAKRMFALYNSAFTYQFTIPFRVPTRMDLEIRALSTVTGANVTGGFGGWRTVNG